MLCIFHHNFKMFNSKKNTNAWVPPSVSELLHLGSVKKKKKRERKRKTKQQKIPMFLTFLIRKMEIQQIVSGYCSRGWGHYIEQHRQNLCLASSKGD